MTAAERRYLRTGPPMGQTECVCRGRTQLQLSEWYEPLAVACGTLALTEACTPGTLKCSIEMHRLPLVHGHSWRPAQPLSTHRSSAQAVAGYDANVFWPCSHTHPPTCSHQAAFLAASQALRELQEAEAHEEGAEEEEEEAEDGPPPDSVPTKPKPKPKPAGPPGRLPWLELLQMEVPFELDEEQEQLLQEALIVDGKVPPADHSHP